MEISDLKPGTKLELDLLNPDELDDFKKVASKLQGINENSLLIDAPIHGSMVYPVHIGATLNVYFSRKTDKQIDVFRFKARVVGREYSGNLALLQIEAEGKMQMIQRRQFYRLECSLPLKYRIVTTMNPEYNKEIKFKASLSRNLSGGGLCICIEDRVNIGETVECEINLYEDVTIRFYGVVVRLEENDLENKYKFLAGITFKKIGNKDREAVVKYIFEQQRKLRKKGLI